MTDTIPAPAFYFRVASADSTDSVVDFQEVSGLESDLSTESIQEDGENRYVHKLPKAIQHPTLELRRGIAAMDSPLVLWCRSVLESTLATPVSTKDVIIDLLDGEGNALRAWTITSAYPVKWEIDPFQANKNQVAIEKIVLTYASCSSR
jgi:phage tail-like protein